MLFLNTTLDGLKMGLCFAIIALGVYISYSILDFPDLSVDSTFPLGGVCSTVLMLRAGVPAPIAILAAFPIGMAAGALTGFLHVKCKITKLLAGIITMTGLLSVNLALTQFLTKSGYTTSIFSYRSENLKGIFSYDFINGFSRQGQTLFRIGMLVLIVIAVKLLMDLFLRTKMGYMLKATGGNEQLVISLGHDSGTYKILGLALANGLVAMSGALYSQLYMSYDNTSGNGKVVLALASVIIGMAVFGGMKRVNGTTAVIFGAIIYSLCLNYLVLLDKNGIYLKLFNAVLFALILIFHDRIAAMFNRRHAKVMTTIDNEILEEKRGDA